MQPTEDSPRLEQEAWKIANGVAFCVATVVGKYASYPHVDEPTFRRVQSGLTDGFRRHQNDRIGDVCQELRGVCVCPVRELLAPIRASDEPRASEVELRLLALADVLRRAAQLPESRHRELVLGLLSWNPDDRSVIFRTLRDIIDGLQRS